MYAKSGVSIILGTGSIGDASDSFSGFSTPQQAQELFNIFRQYGGDEIDSARTYSPNAPGTSEPLVGQTDIATWARISTKVKSEPGDHNAAGIAESTNASLDALKVSSVYINYLHHHDPKTPLAETVAAMDKEYRKGKIQSFGLSNFTVEQVREVLTICEEKGYIKPSVYQGQYNAVARRAEDELIPLLRQHKIRFYAWSPAAGGFFSKDSFRLKQNDFVSGIFRALYDKPEMYRAIERIHEYADAAGLTGHAIALRWALHHSALSRDHEDAIVIGARTLGQLSSTMDICADDRLPQDIVDLIEEIGLLVKNVAPALTVRG